MIQVDVPIAFAIGSVFAAAGHRQLESREPAQAYRIQLQANLYHLFVFSWIPVYFAVNYFGWETSHMWWHADSIAAYPFFVPALLLVLAVALNAGFLVGRSLIRRGRVMANRALYLVIVAYSIVWVVATGERTSRLGTFADLQSGVAPSLVDDTTFLTMLILTMAVWPGVLVVWAVRLLREGARASVRA